MSAQRSSDDSLVSALQDQLTAVKKLLAETTTRSDSLKAEAGKLREAKTEAEAALAASQSRCESRWRRWR